MKEIINNLYVIGATWIYPVPGDICYIKSFDTDEKFKVQMLKIIKTYDNLNEYVLYKYINSGVEEIIEYKKWCNVISGDEHMITFEKINNFKNNNSVLCANKTISEIIKFIEDEDKNNLV
jgi:hypothetical protein